MSLFAAGMGFCVFNNIAVAAAHALEARGLKRIAIVDYDVHHGNGTQVNDKAVVKKGHVAAALWRRSWQRHTGECNGVV
jgi:hypothetical protein